MSDFDFEPNEKSVKEYMSYQPQEQSDVEIDEALLDTERQRQKDYAAGRVFYVRPWPERTSGAKRSGTGLGTLNMVEAWKEFGSELRLRHTLESAVELAERIERSHPFVKVDIIEVWL